MRRLGLISFPLCLAFTLLAIEPSSGAEQVKLYFGAGCFWHIQHAFIEAEKSILGRNDDSYTALAGYAGATASGQFCYYDGKVTTEVVGLEIPTTSVKDFAKMYFKLFVGPDRSHRNDIGPHYRAAIGIPGGVSSSLMSEIKLGLYNSKAVSLWELSLFEAADFQLVEGKGDDPDTLGVAKIWVYDTARFPFQQAEIYHQFHDDYLPGGDYPASYEKLRSVLACSGRLKPTGCKKDDASVLTSLSCSNPSSSWVDTGGSGSLPTNDDAEKGGSGDLPRNDGSDASTSKALTMRDGSNAESSTTTSGYVSTTDSTSNCFAVKIPLGLLSVIFGTFLRSVFNRA